MTNGEKLQETFPNIEIVAIVPDEIVVTKNLDGTYSKISFRYEWWFAKYKEPIAKNGLAVDCISREQALRDLKESAEHHASNSREEVLLKRDRDIIRALPPVTPHEPRKGYWIKTGYYYEGAYGSRDYVECSCCHEDSLEEGDFCPNCGADMREVEE